MRHHLVRTLISLSHVSNVASSECSLAMSASTHFNVTTGLEVAHAIMFFPVLALRSVIKWVEERQSHVVLQMAPIVSAFLGSERRVLSWTLLKQRTSGMRVILWRVT